MPVRLDYQLIESYVAPGSRVLDLGCGDGTLLADLMREKQCRGCGIDVDLEEVRECVARGVPVYHGDMLEGMAMYRDGSFDCVILSQTLQQTMGPRNVVREMLRVGRRAVISFPNFAHWRVRLHLMLHGKMPVTTVLPYTWYNTPNIHLLTVRDFEDLCSDLDLAVIDRIYLSSAYRRLSGFLPNLLASTAIFVVESGAGRAEGR
jgi:methionine biosynthesis protein MetW